jgi:hypothetical protein
VCTRTHLSLRQVDVDLQMRRTAEMFENELDRIARPLMHGVKPGGGGRVRARVGRVEQRDQYARQCRRHAFALEIGQVALERL